MTHGGRRRHHRVAQKEIQANPVSVKNKRKQKRNVALDRTLLMVVVVMIVINVLINVADIVMGERAEK